MSTLQRRRQKRQKSTQNISKSAKTLVAQSGISTHDIVGTGKNGQITVKDVQKAIEMRLQENMHQNDVPTGVERPDKLLKNTKEEE